MIGKHKKMIHSKEFVEQFKHEDQKWYSNFGNGMFKTTAVASAGSNASNIGTFEHDVPAGYTALSTKGLNE